MSTPATAARHWRIVHEWQAAGQTYTMPTHDLETEHHAREAVAAIVRLSPLAPGEAYAIRDPQGVVIHRTYRPA